MIENVVSVDDLRSLARSNRTSNEFQSIPKRRLDEVVEQGWKIAKENKTSFRMVREKSKPNLLEDRVWSMLYKMGFTHFSGKGGAHLAVDARNPDGPKNQIDVVGLDSEVALAIECKTAVQPRRSSSFQDVIAKHALLRERFAKSIYTQFPLKHKRVPILLIFTWDLILSENDLERARKSKVALLNELDLKYYEQLTAHLGTAAKYQFFADMLPGKSVHGLEVSVPALKTKMGKYVCYNFSISPEYLLKISYVSHRAKGQATDVSTYQRMIKKTRLKKIQEYIDQEGIFPTNLVISLENPRHVQFDVGRADRELQGAKHGTLRLRPSYRAAWIIDGQHRLYAYSGHPRAVTGSLNVLAFVGLPPAMQAQLFIDINHEQKSVKKSLLHELFAELNWEAENEGKRIGAIVSKAIQVLAEDKESPFQGRILLTDDTRTDLRCISLESMYKALMQPGMFVVKKELEYGPLWKSDNMKTLKRTIFVVREWFNMIRSGATEWWDLGSGEGGGLAMNDAVTICVGVLRSVFQHFLNKGISLIQLSDKELTDLIRKFGTSLGDYLGTFTEDERRRFRLSCRGTQGQTNGRRKLEAAMHERFSDFRPKGLVEYMELQKADTKKQAYPLIHRIERNLKDCILSTLKAEFGEDDVWWYQAVPQQIRQKIVKRLDEELGQGTREDFFDLIDFRKIALNNWLFFQNVLAYGKKGNKEKRTEWIVKVNSLRKIVMHPTKETVLDWDQLGDLQEYDEWLTNQLKGVES